MIHALEQVDWTQTTLHPLQQIPQVPDRLYYKGALPPIDTPLLTVVGSRRYSSYGKQVVADLINGLQGYSVGIVSGLARGIDGLAHEAALLANLYTLAVPGSGLDYSVLYPSQHRGLAERIIEHGGGLMSELPPTTKAARWTFPQRNRLMAGLATATLLIEATEKSGTLITARLAADYNRELFVVPGNIYAPGSLGVHQFLKLGATPITTSADIIDLLSLQKSALDQTSKTPLTTLAETLLEQLTVPCDIDTLATHSGQPPHEIVSVLMELELAGKIRCENGLYSRRI